MFRGNEIGTFYCDNAEDEIIYHEGNPIGLKDRYREVKLSNCGETKNAICLQNFQKPIKLDTGHYGIPLKNSLYKISDFTTLATAKPSIAVIAFSFRTDAVLTDEDKKLPIGLKDRYREVKLSNCGETKTLYVFKVFKNQLNWTPDSMVSL